VKQLMNKRWISLVMAFIILWGMIPTFASAASTDNWVNRKPDTLRTSNQDVCYGNGKFMAVTDEGGILTSSDGTSWTYYDPGNTFRLTSISCDNGKFVAVTRAGLASSSSDGVIWKTGHTLNNYLYLWDVTYGNGLYVAVGNKITENKGAIYTSTTNEAQDIWTDRNVNTTSILTGVTYGNQRFVAVGQNGTILTSSDGASWTSRNSGTAADLEGVKYLNGKFVSWARDGKTILTSVDGTSWNMITTSGLICPHCESVNSGVLHSVSFGDGTYVGVGSFNSIYTSSDLVSWTKSHEAASGSLNGVTYGNGTFIVVGNNGDIFQNIDPPTYTITYNGNGSTGGTAPTDSNSYAQHATVTVLGNTGSLVKTGSTFAGWNTAAGGNGTPYAANATFGMGAANVTLYAQWTANPTYTVTYNGNGSTGGTVPTDSNPYEQNETVTVLGNTGSLVKTGSTFAGWNTAANGSGTSYAAGATFTMAAANVTLYAQWTVNPTYTVTYNGNGSTGGTVPTDSNPYEQNSTVTVLGNTGSLVKTGNTFVGWNTAADKSGTSYVADATFTMAAANVTLYAQWTASPGGGSGDVPTPPDDSKVISKNGELTLPAGKTGEVSLGDAITIDIPANATDKELKLKIKRLTGTQDLLTDEDVLASPIFEILKNFSENFNKPVTLTFKFDPTKLSGNQRAAVFYYDEVQKKWVEVGGVVKGNQITAVVNHFTKFAVMVVGQAASEPKPTINFSDISAHWAKASIKQAVSSGIVTGYQDGTFKPDKTVTRAEFAVMLMNALKTEGAGAALTFTDTAKIGSWAQKAVAQAVQAGIINGYEDGTFRPAGEITRAEMAAMIAGALGKDSEANATATSFADDNDIPTWAIAAVAYVKQASIMQGKGDNQFAPGDHATRAEAVTVLLNMLAQKSK
jgi:uncharacterized repeat protein (TIGR02543 family)